jgi:hypothetical protein
MNAEATAARRRPRSPDGVTGPAPVVDRWLPAMTAALASAVVVLAVLGPLVTGVIGYRVPPLLEHQLIGSDVVSLAVIAPLASLAVGLLRRRSAYGPLLALAPALATWYLVAELVVGPDRTGRHPGNDEAFLPLFVLVLLLASAVAIGALRALPRSGVRLDRRTRRLAGGLLLLLVALHVLGRYLPMWLDVVAGRGAADYTAAPGIWWTVAFEDLALLLPAAAAAGAGLLRGTRWAGAAAFAASGTLTLVAAAVTGMAWSTTLHGDPGSTTGSALVMTGIGLLSASPAAVCWTGTVRAGRRERTARADSVRAHAS